jgi:hypothetical protein
MSDSQAGPNSSTPPDAPLQFDRAVDSDSTTGAPTGATTCAACNASITKYYYEVNGNTLCAACKHIVAEASKTPRGAGALFKAFLLGGIAAVLGAGVYYGVIALTNFEIGIVAIVIGFMVGWAVRKGASGGGRRFQILAVVMTYFAVGLAYTPLMLKGVMDRITTTADSTRVSDSATASDFDSDSDSTTTADTSESLGDDSALATLAGAPADSLAEVASDTTAASVAKTLAIAIPVALAGSVLLIFALPVLAVFSSMPSGLISAFIIAIGMHQAWKMTGAQLATITGPYRIGGAPPGTAEPDTPAAG